MCIIPLPHGPPNPSQILQKLYPSRALSAPKRSKGTQERPKKPPETAPKSLESLLGALLRRCGRAFVRVGKPNGNQNGGKIEAKALQSSVGQGLSSSFRCSYNFVILQRKRCRLSKHRRKDKNRILGRNSMENVVFYKSCNISVHVFTPPEKHVQKQSKIYLKL